MKKNGIYVIVSMVPVLTLNVSVSGFDGRVKPRETMAPQAPMSLGTNERWSNNQNQEIERLRTAQARHRNWWYKRQYAQEARTLYDAIRAAVNEEITPFKPIFYKKRTESDALVEDFFKEIDIQEEQIDKQLEASIVSLAATRKRDIELTEAERMLLRQLTEKKEALEQLKADLATVKQMDESLDTAMSRVLDQIAQASRYEQHAWQDYNGIIKTLNDIQAQQLYLEMKSLMDSIHDIHGYLSQQLMIFFETTHDRMQQNMSSIKKALESLKSLGIDLSKKVEHEQEIDMIERAQQEKILKEQQEEAARKKAALESSSWLQRLSQWAQEKWSWFKSLFVRKSTAAKTSQENEIASEADHKKVEPKDQKGEKNV